MLKKVKSVTFYTLFETLLLFICFISVVKGEEKFIEPCSDAGGYYTWLGGPNKNHLGHDYNAPVGTPVKAIAEGTVFKVFDISQSRCYDPNTGKEVAQTFIWIKHRLNNGRYFYALYGHIKPSEKIKNNINVKAGEKIGEIAPCYVWDDKRKVLQSAPHLHFGIWDNEIDPPLKIT
jgi:murein DD-endopeptidase MepM/ murein hydrolase activator NlpD